MSLPSLRLTASLAALGAATAVLSAPATSARADEGMWTFDNFPIQTVNDKYGARIDQSWLDRVRNAAVRLRGSVRQARAARNATKRASPQW